MSTSNPDPRVQAVIKFFEQLQPADLARLDQLYCEDAYFKDPFNEVQSLAGVRRIFAHMFETLNQSRFEVLEALCEGNQCFLAWDFIVQRQGQTEPLRIHGSSHLRFAPDGRVAYHRDYWDAAEELYENCRCSGP